jgi:hypothetical protein
MVLIFSSRILMSANVVFVTENESIHIKPPTYGDYLAGLNYDYFYIFMLLHNDIRHLAYYTSIYVLLAYSKVRCQITLFWNTYDKICHVID